MDDLRITLELLFNRISPEYYLDKYLNKNSKLFGVDRMVSQYIDKSKFIDIFSYLNPTYYSKDEIENVYQMVNTNWMKGNNDSHVFNIIRKLSSNMLINNVEEPQVKYHCLLKWTQISKILGEDIFTTAFFSDYDIYRMSGRNNFSWRPIIRTDNSRLRELLSKGVAENHMHLKGSAPHFQISWISLVNNISKRDQEFRSFYKTNSLREGINSILNTDISKIYLLISKAAIIRKEIFKRINGMASKEKFNTEMDNFLSIKSLEEMKIFFPDIQHEISVLKHEYSHKFDCEYVDYCIPRNLSSDNFNDDLSVNSNILLYGERSFLYNCFKLIFTSKYKEIWDPFLIYLTIKSKLRSEMIQVNERVGFSNFASYQDRKSCFIKKKTIYEKSIVNMAIKGSQKDQNIIKFEARIAPEKNKHDYSKEIKKLDNFVDLDLNGSKANLILSKYNINVNHQGFFYVVHFIKEQDKFENTNKICQDAKNNFNEFLENKPRNFTVRNNLKKQSLALVTLRNSNNKSKYRIRGIDAANYEIGCRPEVFSHCYRYFKEYKIDINYSFIRKNDLPSLGFTYHVGEDYLDIIDGLRSIDEAIVFLDLKSGDRIGHGIALGIDIEDYYRSKKYSTILPKQDILDNCTWLYFKMIEFNINEIKLLKELESLFYKYFREIFTNALMFRNNELIYSIKIDDYYDSYKLRGDNPEVYYDDRINMSNLTFWNSVSLRKNDEGLDMIRSNELSRNLYKAYHYDISVREKGVESDIFKVNSEFIKVVKQIQKCIQFQFVQKNIYIEANPSSNYLISSFKRFSKHPLTNFYNIGLTNSVNDINECNQLHVSINTDDQGVFATYLENEYALMALALEKEVDESNCRIYKAEMIYNWLDNIRVKGLEQSFLRR